jgi:hypothetical protein
LTQAASCKWLAGQQSTGRHVVGQSHHHLQQRAETDQRLWLCEIPGGGSEQPIAKLLHQTDNVFFLEPAVIVPSEQLLEANSS